MAGLTEATWSSIVAIVVLPSTFLKDFACIAWQSLLSITSLITMVSVLLWYAINHSSTIKFKNVLFWDTEGALIAIGLLLSSYCVYSILIPIEESMADRSKFKSAFGITMLLANTFKITFALIGFLSFLHETDEVIGNNFPLGTPRILVSTVYVMYVVFSYTLVIYPVFRSIDESRLSLAVAPLYSLVDLDSNYKTFCCIYYAFNSGLCSTLRASDSVGREFRFAFSWVFSAVLGSFEVKMVKLKTSSNSCRWISYHNGGVGHGLWCLFLW